jgi:putative addiction module component (TIGR02574 family)
MAELEIEQLTVPQRLDLMSRLWDSIPDTPEEMPFPDWHRQELERRLERADSEPETAVPWEQVRTRLRGAQ